MDSTIDKFVDQIRGRNIEREILFKMVNELPDREFREMVALARLRGEEDVAEVFEKLRRRNEKIKETK